MRRDPHQGQVSHSDDDSDTDNSDDGDDDDDLCRYILTAGHCVHYCSDGVLPNCSDPIPVSRITFKVRSRNI